MEEVCFEPDRGVRAISESGSCASATLATRCPAFCCRPGAARVLARPVAEKAAWGTVSIASWSMAPGGGSTDLEAAASATRACREAGASWAAAAGCAEAWLSVGNGSGEASSRSSSSCKATLSGFFNRSTVRVGTSLLSPSSHLPGSFKVLSIWNAVSSGHKAPWDMASSRSKGTSATNAKASRTGACSSNRRKFAARKAPFTPCLATCALELSCRGPLERGFDAGCKRTLSRTGSRGPRSRLRPRSPLRCFGCQSGFAK